MGRRGVGHGEASEEAWMINDNHSQLKIAAASRTGCVHMTAYAPSGWDFTDAHGGRNLFKGELSQGLDVLGASSEGRPNPSREGGRTDFTKLQLDAQRVQDLGWITPNLERYLAATGQTSFGQPLLSPEQFGVGGNTFGRDYDPSEIAGDSGSAQGFPQGCFPCGKSMLYRTLCVIAKMDVRHKGGSR